MIVGLPLMKADDGTGVCGTCPERQLSVRTHPHGAPFHDIGKAVVAKRSPLVSQTILSHAQPRRGISLGESQLIARPRVARATFGANFRELYTKVT